MAGGRGGRQKDVVRGKRVMGSGRDARNVLVGHRKNVVLMEEHILWIVMVLAGRPWPLIWLLASGDGTTGSEWRSLRKSI